MEIILDIEVSADRYEAEKTLFALAGEPVEADFIDPIDEEAPF